MIGARHASGDKMTVRTVSELQIQSIVHQVGSLLVVTPVCALLTGETAGGTTLLVVALTIATTLWTQLHNAIFDRVEWALCGRTASDRPSWLRLVHAVSSEASDTIVTFPLILILTGLPWQQALLADVTLTLVGVAYTFVYHRLYDWARPVAQYA
jgi:uncharacterized membrane protein